MAANRSSGAKTTAKKSTKRAASSSGGKTTANSARKSKSTRSKTAAFRNRRRKSEFPPSIAELTTRLRERLRDLDQEIEKIEARYLRIVDRLRNTNSPIGIDFEQSWRVLTDPVRREIVELVRRLEKVVEPSFKSKHRRPAKTNRTAKAA